MLQNAEPGFAKAEFPLAESSILESPEPEPEIEVEAPQCVEESVSETHVTETVAEAPYVSPDAEAASAAKLSKHTPAAPDQAAISHAHAAPELRFASAALVS